jgi:heme/copper-type cytochrome/quinol oxidase subunit 4
MTEAAPPLRDPTTLTRWLEGLLVLSLVVHVTSIFSSVAQYSLLGSADQVPASQFQDLATSNDHRQQIVAIVYLIVSIAIIVLFCFWIYRANCNARALGATGMNFTPGWSVGWFFIPIASLWKPYQAMREIWKASVDPINWRSLPTDPLLGWWWAGFIVSNILGQIAFRMSMAAESVESLRSATIADILSGTPCF